MIYHTEIAKMYIYNTHMYIVYTVWKFNHLFYVF